MVSFLHVCLWGICPNKQTVCVDVADAADEPHPAAADGFRRRRQVLRSSSRPSYHAASCYRRTQNVLGLEK